MTNANRLRFVDSLRGYAALYVLLFHAAQIPQPNMVIPEFIKPFILNGYIGVTLFFVISAFTLCYTLDGKQYDTPSVQKFFIRRIFRIVPLYYVWLFIFVIIFWSYVSKKDLILYGLFGYNFVPGKQVGWVWASWTLGVEMVFYLMFPFIFRYANNLKKAAIFLCITLAISFSHSYLIGLISIQAEYSISLSLFSQMPVFASGIIAYFIFNRLQDNKVLGKWLVWGSLVAFVTSPYLFQITYVLQIYVMMIVFAALLVGLSLYSPKMIVNHRSVFIGMISYSLYLNHPKIVSLMAPFYQRIASFSLGKTATFLICETITVFLLICVSYVTFKLIEEPGMNLGRRIINGMKKKAVPA